jgi:hypothetical protein
MYLVFQSDPEAKTVSTGTAQSVETKRKATNVKLNDQKHACLVSSYESYYIPPKCSPNLSSRDSALEFGNAHGVWRSLPGGEGGEGGANCAATLGGRTQGAAKMGGKDCIKKNYFLPSTTFK